MTAATVGAIAFLIGLFLAIFCTMLAQEKHILWPYGIPVAYAALLLGIDAFVRGRAFDWQAACLLAVVLLALGWLVVRFEVARKAK